jgi:ubiquinone/menaquinone biosynthesis C-methylase UbiE
VGSLKKAVAQLASSLRVNARRNLVRVLVDVNMKMLRSERRSAKNRRRPVRANLATVAVALQLGVDQALVKAWLSGKQIISDQKMQRVLQECLRVARETTLNLLELEVARLNASLEQLSEKVPKG